MTAFLHFQIWQWLVMAIAALGIGFAKTGINGVGILAVALFALALPARESVGVVLPILIAADLVAVRTYHRKASWPHLWRLCPWAVAGVLAGWLTMNFMHLSDAQVAHVIGAILLVILAVQWWRERNHLDFDQLEAVVPHNIWFTATMGILGGFATMMANAAGPIMILYLLSTRLPKLEHIGTGAWYFCMLNIFKVPFSIQLHLINPHSIQLSAAMMPCALAGALVGRVAIHKVDQVLFNKIAFFSTFVAAIHISGIDRWLITLGSRL